MAFKLNCVCGKRIVPPPGSAGGTVACECGETIAVPTLGEMRASGLMADDIEPTVRSIPVAKVCPVCGSDSFRKVPPSRLVAFTSDRVCLQCSRQYTPPTPIWAAILFLIVGIPLAGFGLLALPFHLLGGMPHIPALLFEGALGIAGAAAVWHAVRVLRQPGKI